MNKYYYYIFIILQMKYSDNELFFIVDCLEIEEKNNLTED